MPAARLLCGQAARGGTTDQHQGSCTHRQQAVTTAMVVRSSLLLCPAAAAAAAAAGGVTGHTGSDTAAEPTFMICCNSPDYGCGTCVYGLLQQPCECCRCCLLVNGWTSDFDGQWLDAQTLTLPGGAGGKYTRHLQTGHSTATIHSIYTHIDTIN
jgi:hypothetical protein